MLVTVWQKDIKDMKVAKAIGLSKLIMKMLKISSKIGHVVVTCI